MSVNDRLARLLFIVPYVVRRDGVPLTELADLLGVSTQQITADLDLLTMVGQPPLTPDHLIDLYVEDDIVYVALDQSLTRPLRLTHNEARALVLGAKLIGNSGAFGSELERILKHIMDLLNPVDRQSIKSLSERVAIHGSNSAAPTVVAAQLHAAIERQCIVRLLYYSVSSDRQKNYRLKPLALITHGGVDYLVAWDVDADDQEKLFRLDRLADVQTEERKFTPPNHLDLEKFRTKRLYFGSDALHAEVRFSAPLARRVRERFSEQEILATTADGSLHVRVATSSAAWLTRWVLSFGEEAEIIGPMSCRDHIREFCAAAAAVYKDSVEQSTPKQAPGDASSIVTYL